MRVRALTVSVALAAGGVVGVVPPAAAADSAHLLELTDVRDVLVDDAHARVFLTGGGSQGLVVRTMDGAAVTTVENLPGADELVLSPDGSRLYVALAHGDAVAAIDPVTLTETARYPTGAATCRRAWPPSARRSGSGTAAVRAATSVSSTSPVRSPW